MRRTARLRLESLEARETPALSIFFTGSTLNVVGVPDRAGSAFVGDGLNLEWIGTGLRVREVNGAKIADYGTYKVTGDLNVNLRHDNCNINLDLNDNRLPGHANFNLGNGDIKTLTVNPINLVDGIIGGNVSIRGGSGLEVINFGQFGNSANAIDVQGDVFAYTSAGSNANDLFGVGDAIYVNDDSRLRRNLITNQVDSIVVGGPGATAQIDGMIVLNVKGSGNTGEMNIYGAVGGNIAYVGSDNVFDPFGDVLVVESGGSVGGYIAGSMGQGPGRLEVRPGGVVNRNVQMAFGNYDDTVELNGDIYGATTLTMFQGDNNIAFNGNILGNLSVTAGNGDDDFSIFSGTVYGNVDLNMGQGENIFVLNGGIFGNRLAYVGGGGGDTIEINGSNNFVLTAFLGAGADMLTISQSDGVASGRVDFGQDFDNDVWNPPPVIPVLFTLVGYP